MKTATSIFVLLGIPMALAVPTTSPSHAEIDGDMVRRTFTARDGKGISLSLHNSLVQRSKKERRWDFPSAQPGAFMGNECGDSSFDATAPADFPQIDDCKDIVSGLNGMDRHWELSNGGIVGVPDWIKLAESGTCGFYIYRRDFPDITTSGVVFVGTQDVADLIQVSLDRYSSYSSISTPTGPMQFSHLIPTHGSMLVNPIRPRFKRLAVTDTSLLGSATHMRHRYNGEFRLTRRRAMRERTRITVRFRHLYIDRNILRLCFIFLVFFIHRLDSIEES
jgi:hypothetical protein